MFLLLRRTRYRSYSLIRLNKQITRKTTDGSWFWLVIKLPTTSNSFFQISPLKNNARPCIGRSAHPPPGLNPSLQIQEASCTRQNSTYSLHRQPLHKGNSGLFEGRYQQSHELKYLHPVFSIGHHDVIHRPWPVTFMLFAEILTRTPTTQSRRLWQLDSFGSECVMGTRWCLGETRSHSPSSTGSSLVGETIF